MKNCTLIDNATGEVLSEDFKITELQDIRERKVFAQKDKLSKEFKELQDKISGNFVFFIFKNMEFLKENLNDNDLVKFIYIGTYVKKEGVLMLDNNVTYIDKRRLRSLLNVGDKAFNTFYNKMLENNLMKEHDGKLYINFYYFWRGKESDYKKFTNVNLEDYTRIYTKATRELYNQIPGRGHKKLAIVFKLLPYVNWKYNILCKNTNEVDENKLEVLTIADIVELLNYNKTQMARFKSDFYSLKYNEYNVFASVQKQSDYLKSFILVNPLIYYRGNDIEQLQYLVTLFKIRN
ncbi:hypothetical protein GCM10008905_16540 [Clostridium malenominatum]|uniref:Uncharacterized protein n=1 Tax=Clostridium malenominatum TaxID=1539 RepID=A0ABP3U964_9CLOT